MVIGFFAFVFGRRSGLARSQIKAQKNTIEDLQFEKKHNKNIVDMRAEAQEQANKKTNDVYEELKKAWRENPADCYRSSYADELPKYKKGN